MQALALAKITCSDMLAAANNKKNGELINIHNLSQADIFEFVKHCIVCNGLKKCREKESEGKQ